MGVWPKKAQVEPAASVPTVDWNTAYLTLADRVEALEIGCQVANEGLQGLSDVAELAKRLESAEERIGLLEERFAALDAALDMPPTVSPDVAAEVAERQKAESKKKPA